MPAVVNAACGAFMPIREFLLNAAKSSAPASSVSERIFISPVENLVSVRYMAIASAPITGDDLKWS